MAKDEYNRLYKDETRVVVYASPDVKAFLAQTALDKGQSLSEFCKPKLEELAKEHGYEKSDT